MKKLLSLVLSLALIMAMFTACGKSDKTEDTSANPTAEPTQEATQAPTEEPTQAPADTTAATAKTGLGVVSSIAKSTNAAADAEGLGETDSLAVAVLVGQDGKILDCQIDMGQTKVNFSTEGKITTDLASVVKSKQELGTDYGMKGISGIGKEWNEQADAFAAYVIGKTVDEVKGIAVNDKGTAGDADLASSVTIHIGDFIAATEKAVNNAQDLGALATDKIGLGIITQITGSKDVAADADGLAQAYSYYVVTTSNAEGVITSSFVDASIGNVNFNAKGEITTDLAVGPQTKQELKDAYGMKKASGIGKEWYEQANAFATYVTGKTIDQVKGIAVTEDGHAGDADLASSVTVHVGPFIQGVDKAFANAAK